MKVIWNQRKILSSFKKKFNETNTNAIFVTFLYICSWNVFDWLWNEFLKYEHLVSQNHGKNSLLDEGLKEIDNKIR